MRAVCGDVRGTRARASTPPFFRGNSLRRDAAYLWLFMSRCFAAADKYDQYKCAVVLCPYLCLLVNYERNSIDAAASTESCDDGIAHFSDNPPPSKSIHSYFIILLIFCISITNCSRATDVRCARSLLCAENCLCVRVCIVVENSHTYTFEWHPKQIFIAIWFSFSLFELSTLKKS